MNSKLFQQIFFYLNNQNINLNLHENLATCLVNILYFYYDNSSSYQHQLINYNNSLLTTLKENIIKLSDAYKYAQETKQTEK